MARRAARSPRPETAVEDYRHDDASRKNNPPASLAAQGQVRETPRLRYAYDAHRPPALRFDETGEADRLPELLETAKTRALTAEEAQTLAAALRIHQPWLEWAGKREKAAFEVDPVALHVHERVSAQAVLKVAQREDPVRSLWAEPELTYREALQFYEHDVDWANRMILGDSLSVMASLARREDLAGKVQMIYMDPPYGIRFASNFQPEIGRRDVKEKESDLTREPEMVKAYRDTWNLGVHSYLDYLRDRLLMAKELLADTGSIFVQISDENLHRVRAVMDEVFGAENCCQVITFSKTSGQADQLLSSVSDYLLWYARKKSEVKYNQIFSNKQIGGEASGNYSWLESSEGTQVRKITPQEIQNPSLLPTDSRPFSTGDLMSQEYRQTTSLPYTFNDTTYDTGISKHWKTTTDGLERLNQSNRSMPSGKGLYFKRYLDDFPAFPLTNIWTDTSSSFSERRYVVQTITKVIQRCVLMTTDPGDLVLDPTCGSGTTAFVAEQWGRRWITMDTSRVALSLARQRLLTAVFPHYKTQDGGNCPASGFRYKTVPHITLKSIAQNAALDPIFARHQPVLDAALVCLNAALPLVTPEVRATLEHKLRQKTQAEGKKAVTDADCRRWLLPKAEDGWKEWEVPFDTDPDWPEPLRDALTAYRAAWKAKMDEVNALIAAGAEPEALVDQPEEARGVVRVSGPFTMEAVMPAEARLDVESPIAGEPEALETFEASSAPVEGTDGPANADAYLDKMIRLLLADGVRFPGNRTLRFTRLARTDGGGFLHAEGEWETEDGQTRQVAVSFGPEYGPVTAFQVEETLRSGYRRGYDDLVFAGFSFDAAAQAVIQEDPNPRLRCHLAHIRPDVAMGDLLKETPNSQLFTVFGSPRTLLKAMKDGLFTVTMEGVDIYNPVDNTLTPTRADKVAAWFLDTDYDGQTFCITQAFFPDKSAWEKLARALKSVVDEEQFAAFAGTVSLPFPAGKYGRVAMKVIDPRGNEAMKIHTLQREMS